jgi:hypothetical protein
VLVLSERTPGIQKWAFIQTVPLHCHHFFLSRASIMYILAKDIILTDVCPAVPRHETGFLLEIALLPLPHDIPPNLPK